MKYRVVAIYDAKGLWFYTLAEESPSWESQAHRLYLSERRNKRADHAVVHAVLHFEDGATPEQVTAGIDRLLENRLHGEGVELVAHDHVWSRLDKSQNL